MLGVESEWIMLEIWKGYKMNAAHFGEKRLAKITYNNKQKKVSWLGFASKLFK